MIRSTRLVVLILLTLVAGARALEAQQTATEELCYCCLARGTGAAAGLDRSGNPSTVKLVVHAKGNALPMIFTYNPSTGETCGTIMNALRDMLINAGFTVTPVTTLDRLKGTVTVFYVTDASTSVGSAWGTSENDVGLKEVTHFRRRVPPPPGPGPGPGLPLPRPPADNAVPQLARDFAEPKGGNVDVTVFMEDPADPFGDPIEDTVTVSTAGKTVDQINDEIRAGLEDLGIAVQERKVTFLGIFDRQLPALVIPPRKLSGDPIVGLGLASDDPGITELEIQGRFLTVQKTPAYAGWTLALILLVLLASLAALPGLRRR